jgi:hypothetical protein
LADDVLLRPHGRRTYVRQGGYTTLASLQADIQRYALGQTS